LGGDASGGQRASPFGISHLIFVGCEVAARWGQGAAALGKGMRWRGGLCMAAFGKAANGKRLAVKWLSLLRLWYASPTGFRRA